MDDDEIEGVRKERKHVKGGEMDVDGSARARRGNLRAVYLIGIRHRDRRMTSCTYLVCDRDSEPRIVDADLKRAVAFAHTGHGQRRGFASEPSGAEHRPPMTWAGDARPPRRNTIERMLNHSRVLVRRAYTCPLISIPRNRAVCLVGSFAGCAMIFAGFPALTT